MRVEAQKLAGVYLIYPQILRDDRGQFSESYHADRYRLHGIDATFVQDNVSVSHPNVLRGLHFQNPNGQGKLVQVVKGHVFDVVVDLRTSSPTYGQWEGFHLTDEDSCQLYVPPGFAHGFLSITDAIFCYKCTDVYTPQSEATLLWNDPELKIAWPLSRPPLVNAKDQAGMTFVAYQNFARKFT